MAIWEEKKMKKKTVPTRHAILLAGIQEEKRQAQIKEAYGITEEVTVVEKKSRTAQLLRVLVNAISVSYTHLDVYKRQPVTRSRG